MLSIKTQEAPQWSCLRSRFYFQDRGSIFMCMLMFSCMQDHEIQDYEQTVCYGVVTSFEMVLQPPLLRLRFTL